MIASIACAVLAVLCLPSPAQASAAASALTLDSPAPGALVAGGQPTFSGSAATGSGASDQVTVRVYHGSAATGAPLESLSTIAVGGGYSVGPRPALADGLYTARAEQDDGSNPPVAAFSPSTTFDVHNSPPTITLSSASPESLHTAAPILTGRADAAGDAGNVTIAVYAGAGTSGSPVRVLAGGVAAGGAYAIRVNGLPDGRYTAVAAQSAAGTVGLSAPLTFTINGPAPPVTLYPAAPAGAPGSVSVPITCAAPAGTNCAGSVLVLTIGDFQPVSGGPTGQLRVLFTHVSIPGGQTQVVRGAVPAPVARALRRAVPGPRRVALGPRGSRPATPLRVRVTTTLSQSGGPPMTVSGVRTVRTR